MDCGKIKKNPGEIRCFDWKKLIDDIDWLKPTDSLVMTDLMI